MSTGFSILKRDSSLFLQLCASSSLVAVVFLARNCDTLRLLQHLVAIAV